MAFYIAIFVWVYLLLKQGLTKKRDSTNIDGLQVYLGLFSFWRPAKTDQNMIFNHEIAAAGIVELWAI